MADKTTPGGVLHDPVNGKRLDEPSAVNLDARLREVSTEAGDEADRAEAAAKDAAASAARAEAIVPGIEAEVRAVVLASPELKGEPGAPGPAPSIKIGTVTSGATPSATIKGTSPDLTLDLVLPQPAPGAVVDPYSIRGPGRPDVPSTTGGVITGAEPVGAEYRSTDGANVGAWTWRKRPTGWAVTDGDTGWRRVPFPAALALPDDNFNRLNVRRSGGLVTARVQIQNVGGRPTIWTAPDGWRDSLNWATAGQNYMWGNGLGIQFNRTNGVQDLQAQSGRWHLSWQTDDPWPTAPLPGNPA